MSTRKGTRRRPASSDDAREHQLVSDAIDLAEKQIRAGTASSQVITHFLKLGSTRERLEQERLHRENLLLEAKVDQMASMQRIEELYEEALGAMRIYTGRESERDEEMEQYYD